MNTFGFFIGLITLVVIGMGFVWVIRGERYLGLYWWPYFMTFGIILVIISFFISNPWGAVMSGVIGGSFIWGSTEFKEQAIRAELGWYPFHAKKLRPPLESVIKQIKPPHL